MAADSPLLSWAVQEAKGAPAGRKSRHITNAEGGRRERVRARDAVCAHIQNRGAAWNVKLVHSLCGIACPSVVRPEQRPLPTAPQNTGPGEGGHGCGTGPHAVVAAAEGMLGSR